MAGMDLMHVRPPSCPWMRLQFAVTFDPDCEYCSVLRSSCFCLYSQARNNIHVPTASNDREMSVFNTSFPILVQVGFPYSMTRQLAFSCCCLIFSCDQLGKFLILYLCRNIYAHFLFHLQYQKCTDGNG